MSRQEFKKSIRVARVIHATKDGVLYCEGCGVQLKIGQFAFDHDNPDGLTGEPTFENCRVLCTAVCHTEKTKVDAANIAEAKRREASRLGIAKPIAPDQKIISPPMPTTRKAAARKERIERDPKPMPARRPIYVDM